MKRILISFSIIVLICSCLFAQKVTYHLKIENPHRNYFEVQIEYLCNQDEYVDFILPAWSPGHYIIDDWAKNVFQVNAETDQGKELSVRKLDKQTWRVTCNPGDKVSFSYKIYAYSLGNPNYAHVELNFAFYNGTYIFMFIDGKQSLPIEIKFVYPEHWDFHTSLTRKISNNNYAASNYDELVRFHRNHLFLL